MPSTVTFSSLDVETLAGFSSLWPILCAPIEPTTEGVEDNSTPRKRCRILVVDDEDDYRSSLIFKLKKLYGATVEEAKDGSIALEKVEGISEGKGFDLILMDISMPPGPTGIETSKEMLKRGVGARIVLMSAYSTPENQQEAQALGIILLTKPIDKDTLENIILTCGGNTIS